MYTAIYNAAFTRIFFIPTAHTSNPLLPAVVSLGVVVLLLITCVTLVAIALAVNGIKRKKLRAEKAHTDPLHCYNQTGGGEEETKDRIYDEVGLRTCPVERQSGPYRELEIGTMEKRQYASLNKDTTANV